jgi:hypothetical protein
MDTLYRFRVGSTLPSMRFRWNYEDDDGNTLPYDFSTGWTFGVTVAPLADKENVLTIVSTITVAGSAAAGTRAPNIVVTMSTTNVSQILAAYVAEYGALTEPTAMVAYIKATRTADSLPMDFAAGDEPVWTLLPTVS